MPKTMKLPCKLEDADRLRIGEQLTAEIKAREQVEAAKKAAVKDFNVALKSHKAREHDFNESLFTGTELREVEVEERPDYAAGITFIHRLDTGDCVQQRAIDPDERQVGMNLDGPTAGERGAADDAARTDEQREATTPEEAEAMRVERLANERAERISAAVTEALEHINVELMPADPGPVPDWHRATLNYGGREFEATARDPEGEAQARLGVITQLTEHLEATEDTAATWADVAAASKAEQDRQEVERLAAEQAADDASWPKRGFKRGLKAPPRPGKKTRHLTVLPDGREVDPEVEAAALDASGAPEREAREAEIDGTMCPPFCDENHVHTEARTAF